MKLNRFSKRILLGLLLVPVLLVTSLSIYIQQNQSEIINGEIEKLNQSYPGLIRVGESNLSLFGDFPYVSLKIDEVQIFETKAADAAVIMDVKDIYVGFNLTDLLKGDYDIQSIVIEDGIFNIVIHTDQTTNIENAIGTGQTATDSSETSLSNIQLEKIEFRNLDIHTLDEATQMDVDNFIYAGEGGFSLKDGVISGHIDTEFELSLIEAGDTSFIDQKHFEIHTDIVFDEATGVLQIAPSGILMENGDFEFSGSIDTKADLDLDLEIKGQKPNFDMLLAFAPKEVIEALEPYENAGEIYFTANMKGPVGSGDLPYIQADFGAGKAFVSNTSTAKKIDNMGFKGHFTNGENRDASTMEFSLQEMAADLEEGVFKGSILIKNFESPEVDMQIDSKFDLDFIAAFLELEQVQQASGSVTLQMNFHDIIDFDHPEKAIQQLNQAYYAALKVEDLTLDAAELPMRLDTLNIDLVMTGKQAQLNQFELIMGQSDLSMSGFLSDLPAVIHHSNSPVQAHVDISSNYLDIAQLTGYSAQDSSQTGVDEQVENLRLGFSFLASAKAFTESEYLPEGMFFIDSLHADLKHYPHRLHDFHADVMIDDKDLKIKDFNGYIDESDFHMDGLIHDYAFWMQPELNGDVDLDINLTSSILRLEDLFSYKGENFVPEEYRHEIFDDLTLHFRSSMHYKDSALHAIDVDLDKLDTKMEVHPQRFHDFRGNIHYEDEHIVIQDFHGEIGSTNFNFDLNYYLGEDQAIKKRDNYLELRANYIDYDALFDFNLSPPEPMAVITNSLEDVAAHAEAFNIYELPFTDMRFKVDVAHFIYHRLDLQNIQSDLRITPDHYIYIDTLHMNAAGGSIDLSGYFNGSDPKHIYMQPRLTMDNVDLDQLLFKFENFGQDHLVSENLKGKLTASITGKIRVYPDLVPDLDQSFIEMEVKVLDGELKKYDPMLALSDYMGDKDLQNIRFDTLQNNLDVNKGEISIPAMTIESTLGHIELSGTHDSEHNIDYYIRIPRKTVRQAAWSKLFGAKGNDSSNKSKSDEIEEVDPNTKIKYLNLQVQGTLDDYKIALGKKK